MKLKRLPIKMQLLLSLYGVKLWPDQNEIRSAYKSLCDSGLVTDPDKPELTKAGAAAAAMILYASGEEQ